MFSIIFPGQGSQNVGMAKEFYDNFDYVRNYFSIADELLGKNLTASGEVVKKLESKI